MMNRQIELQTSKLFIHIVVLAVWSTVSAFLLMRYAPALSLLGIALNLFVMVLSLTDLFPLASWASMLVSIAMFAGAGYSLLDINRDFLISTGVGAGIFLITTIVCTIYASKVRQVNEKYTRLQQVADSLMIYDRSTSLMRWKFAKQTLTTEILRGRRYNHAVSLVLFDYRNRDQFTREDIRRINQVVSEILQDGIRTNLDIAFINDHLGMILPETGSEGALILTRRLIQRANRQVDARLVAGISSFPSDAITEEDIISNAKSALSGAINSELPAVDYHTMRLEMAVERSDLENIQKMPLSNESSQQDYVSILENIDLDEDEWIVWIEGFNKMEDLAEVEHRFSLIDHINAVEFLFLQESHLVIKIKSTDNNLLGSTDPFPGWEVLKNSPNNRYWLVAMKADVSQEDQS